MSDIPLHAGAARSEMAAKIVLIVDDEKDSKVLLTRFIESLGCRTLTATSGEQGFLMAHTYQPDLIVVDLMLGDCYGWDLLRRLKEQPSTASIPAIVVSGVASRNQHEFVLRAAGFLDKPVKYEALVSLVNEHMKDKAGKVLVVDDSIDDRTLISRFLSGLCDEVRSAEHGAAALDALESGFRPDLVLLDLLMPVMDGFEFVRRTRTDERFRDLPIVVVSAKSLSADEKKRLAEQNVAVVGKRNNLSRDLRRALRDVISPAGPPPPDDPDEWID